MYFGFMRLIDCGSYGLHEVFIVGGCLNVYVGMLDMLHVVYKLFFFFIIII